MHGRHPEIAVSAVTIVASIVHDIHAAIDMDEKTLSEVEAAVEALSAYDMCKAGTDGHEDCDPDDPCRGMDDWPSLRDVGDVIAEWLQDRIDEHVTDATVRTLLLDLLDLGSSAVLDELGRRFYPGDAYRALITAGYIR